MRTVVLSQPPSTTRDPADFVPGGSELAGLIRQFDWSSTALGPIGLWPQSLKLATAMVVASPTAIVMLWGPDGVMIYNDAYSEFAGARHPHLLGSSVRTGWAEVADFNDNVMRVGLAGGTLTYTNQELTLHRNGRPEQVWMNLDYSPVFDEAGKPAGVIAIVVETTKQVLAERDRAEFERSREFGRTWEVSPDLMSVLSTDGYFMHLNPAWSATLGWPREHLATKRYCELIHPDDLQTSIAAFSQLARGEPVLHFENRYAHADGGWRWLSWVAVPAEGRFYCAARDVTAAHEAEAERDRLWTLSEDMLARASYEGDMSAVNPAWTKVLGWSEQELLTNPYADIINPEDVGATVAALASMAETCAPTRFENRILASNGEWKPIGWTVSPEPDGANFIAVGRDLSDYKAREHQLIEAQEALRQSQKMEAVGQLTGGIAHDFNNLLAGISGSLELMQLRLGEGRIDDVRRYIAMAQGSSARAASLTQRLLAFSRRQTLDPRSTDVTRLIDGIEDLLRRTIGPDIVLEVIGDPQLWPALIDGPQLENVLINVCINARDAMPDGGRITIFTENIRIDDSEGAGGDVPAGEYLVIAVTDTGTGMTPDVAARAFDPFFTTKPMGQGTGLGLSMTYGFVRQSGGRVQIETAPGNGTTIRLHLPRCSGADKRDADRADPTPLVTALEVAREREENVVLVVDDEAAVRQLMIEVLNDGGHRTIEADDGASALRLLQSDTRIDLLVTDVGLPGGMNGRQVADFARSTRPDLKILFVTGYVEKAAVGNGLLDAGMEVITKPFTMHVLSGKVQAMLRQA